VDHHLDQAVALTVVLTVALTTINGAMIGVIGRNVTIMDLVHQQTVGANLKVLVREVALHLDLAVVLHLVLVA
jgi:hypothetical protein